MIHLRVRLEALDPLLFGDNRPARAGEDHTQEDQDPSPLTLYGAIGARIAAAYGVDKPGPKTWGPVAPVLGEFQTRPGTLVEDAYHLRGYTLADAEGRSWFPAPRHLRLEEKGDGVSPFDLLEPRELPDGFATSAPYDWLLDGGEPESEAEGAFHLARSLMPDVLAGTLPGRQTGRPTGQVEPADRQLFRPEGRIGLALANRSNTAVSGRLFSRPYRRFETQYDTQGWQSAGYTAWITVPALAGKEPQDLDGVGFLGGDRGRARLTFQQDEPLADLRQAVERSAPDARGFFLMLLTPVPAGTEWPTIEGREPVTTAVGKGRWVSGWNRSQHRPRKSRVLVPEGSVAFYRWPDGRSDEDSRRELVRYWWLRSIGNSLVNEGFGRVLVGLWGGGATSHG